MAEGVGFEPTEL